MNLLYSKSTFCDLKIKSEFLICIFITKIQIRALNSHNIHESTCLLLIDLKYATDLPEVKKSSGIHDPNARVHLTINEKSVLSVTQHRTTNPKWYENHYFFVDNPDTETLAVSVHDEKSNSEIATCNIRLAMLFGRRWARCGSWI